MGLIEQIFSSIFGDGRNVIVETAQVFREDAEGAGVREAAIKQQAMQQYVAEFTVPRQGWFDRLMDGLNRLPRPFLAFGTIGLFIVAMVDPVSFSIRMQGIAMVVDGRHCQLLFRRASSGTQPDFPALYRSDDGAGSHRGGQHPRP